MLQVGLHRGMAVQTNLLCGCFGPHGITAGMSLVAVGTADICLLVGTGGPVQTLGCVVAAEAGLVFAGGISVAEIPFYGTGGFCQMGAAGSVAVSTAKAGTAVLKMQGQVAAGMANVAGSGSARNSHTKTQQAEQ